MASERQTSRGVGQTITQYGAYDHDKRIYEKVNISFPERLGLRLYSEYSPSGKIKPFDERTESDWATRYWQYDEEYNDRRASPVKFQGSAESWRYVRGL